MRRKLSALSLARGCDVGHWVKRECIRYGMGVLVGFTYSSPFFLF